MKTNYNPERRAWKGRSYKRGGQRIQELAESQPETLAEMDAEEAYVTAPGPAAEFVDEGLTMKDVKAS